MRWPLALIALASLASVAGALIGQHRYDMQPCPWCILQRIIFLVLALLLLWWREQGNRRFGWRRPAAQPAATA